jgi:hypothetical protein
LELLEKGPYLFEDAIDGLVCIDISHFLLLLELTDHLEGVLPICAKPFFDDLWSIVTASLL